MVNKGLLYEVQATAKLIEHGLKVSHPLCPSSKYDLIVDNGNSLFKVQVKKTTRQNPSGSFRCRVCFTDKKGKQMLYKKGDVDVFLIFIEPLNVWYVVPYDDTEGRHELTINPKKPVYETYEDAWLLFNDAP